MKNTTVFAPDPSFPSYPGVDPAAVMQMATVLPPGEAVDAVVLYVADHFDRVRPQGVPLLTNVSPRVVSDLAPDAEYSPDWVRTVVAGLRRVDAVEEAITIVNGQGSLGARWADALNLLNPAMVNAGLSDPAAARELLGDEFSYMVVKRVAPALLEGISPDVTPTKSWWAAARQVVDLLSGTGAFHLVWPHWCQPPAASRLLSSRMQDQWLEESIMHYEEQYGVTTEQVVETLTTVSGEKDLPVAAVTGLGVVEDWVEDVLFAPDSLAWKTLIGNTSLPTARRKVAAGRVVGQKLMKTVGTDSGAWLTAVQLLQEWDGPLTDWLDLQVELNR